MPLVCKPRTKGIQFLAFNQDESCVAIATNEGIKIYSLEGHDLCFDYPVGSVCVIEMLFCTSLLAFVGAGEQPSLTPRKLRVMNTSTQTTIRDLSFPSSVLAIRMNRKRLVALLENRCYVHHLDTLEILRILETPPNPKGLIAVSPSSDSCLLALPSSSTSGKVQVYDMLVEGGNALSEIPAHNSPVDTMAFNQAGTVLATASAKGTVIRVFRMPHGQLLHSFRRGTYSASVYSLAFFPSGDDPELLCATSSHGSVHLFHLKEAERHPAAAAASSIMSHMMPKSITDMVDSPRSLGTVKLPFSNVPALCSMQPADGNGSGGEPGAWLQPEASARPSTEKVKLAVVSMEGILYEYSVTVFPDQENMLNASLEREGSLFG